MSLTVDDILGPDGLIARHLVGYERRGEQLEMARAVAAAFAAGEHLLAEAGTGVGKSFAYLAPAILRVAEIQRRVVVSTYTIALQEQLIHKDMPFLAEVLPIDFTADLGKGRTNYLCLRRLALTIKNRQKVLGTDKALRELEMVADWAMESETGCRQEIEFALSASVWEKVCSQQGLCSGTNCARHGQCFLQAARQRMQAADIVVVNHALFFSDLALHPRQAGFIGPYDHVVLDEAHTLEQVASDHFGVSVSSAGAQHLLRELYNDKTDRGLLALISDKAAIAAANRAASAAENFFRALAAYDGPALGSSGRIRRADLVPNDLTGALKTLANRLGHLRRGRTQDDQSFELLGFETNCNELAQKVDRLISQADEDYAYWVTRHPARRGRGPLVTLASAPINVAPIVRSLLFDAVHSAVLTSATLATSRGGHHGFDYIRHRLGLEDGDDILLASPFDFRRQARLYIETKLGDPNDLSAFVPAATRAIEHYAEKSQGRCFVLFTSYAMLQAVADQLAAFATRRNYELLVQGGALPQSSMLEKFRTKSRCVLLGTMSFWQGVDVAGEALGNVIITKLPFAVPNDPIVEARIDTIRAVGRDPFMEYQLPEAVIRFKQGFGRLIRSTTDTGFVVVLDHRIVTRHYGRMFLGALPDIEIVRDECAAES